MSTPPPFPPGPPQPGGHQPPYQAAPPPAWQAGAPASGPGWAGSGLAPGQAPPKRSRLPLILLVLLLLAGAGVGAFFVFRGDDSSDDGIDAARARDGLESILRDASFDEDGNDTLNTCPLG